MLDIKETLIDLLTGYSLDTYEDVQYVADELIAKGVLPVVRCKDCKHLERYQKANWCEVFDDGYHHPDDNDFCSYGVRRGTDGN